jgi:hypothetical protein
LTLNNTSSFSHDQSKCSFPSSTSTTFQNFPGVSDMIVKIQVAHLWYRQCAILATIQNNWQGTETHQGVKQRVGSVWHPKDLNLVTCLETKHARNGLGLKHDPQKTQWCLRRPSRVSNNQKFFGVRN